MRRSLAWISASVTGLVAIAFLVPLLVLVGDSVRERAVAEAYRSAMVTGSVLAVSQSVDYVASLVAGAEASGIISVYLPRAGLVAQKAEIEHVVTRAELQPAAPRVAALEAMRSGAPATVPTHGGMAVLQPVALSGGRMAVVEIDIPDAVLERGVTRARVSLTVFALALVAASIALADRLAARVVRSAGRLQAASNRLGSGDLAVRVLPEGPEELAAAARAFNLMADRVGDLLVAERELMADLSHRLRTPLAGLVLAGRSLGSGVTGDQVRALTTKLQEEVDAIIHEARQSPRPASPPECDAVAVLRERLDFWGALAEDQGRGWTLALPRSVQRVDVPVRQADLQAVVDALVGNVFLHTPEGCAFEVVLRVGVRTELVVGDAGPGIREPERAVRRGASGAGSSGLGLDIVTRVAQTTGGQLLIGRSRLGGAEITLAMPTVPRAT